MTVELLAQVAIKRDGRVKREDVLALAHGVRDADVSFLAIVRAYIAAEDFAIRSGSRDQARQCLEDADDAIENWAQSRYGDDWRDLVRAAMEPCKASEPVVMETTDAASA